MNSPIENTDTAAAKDDQVVRINPTDEITIADTQDTSLASKDYSNSHDSKLESSTGSEQDVVVNEQTQKSRADNLFAVCDGLNNQMGDILEGLERLMIQGVRFRADIPRATSVILQIDHVSENRWRNIRKKLRREKRISDALSDIQVSYRDSKRTCQATLETYSDVRGSGSRTIALADLEDAIEALRYLEEGASRFRMTVRSLLHTVFLPKRKAMMYLWSLAVSRDPYKGYGNQVP